MNQDSNNKGNTTRGRVHSPSMAESVRMTYTGIKNRLGRTIVTWVGIVLGIAFLMATFLSANIRTSLQKEADRYTKVQSMTAILRAEVGDLKQKKVVLIRSEPLADGQLLEEFLDHLRDRSPQLELAGPLTVAEVRSGTDVFTGASGAIVWAAQDVPLDAAQWEEIFGKMKQRVVLLGGQGQKLVEEAVDEEEVSPGGITAEGARVRPLLPNVTEQQKARQEDELVKRHTRTKWLVGVSLLVAAIGISNALLMSVTERYREIGTMKCLGALNGFIIRLILLESGFLGLLGALAGVAVGSLFAIFGYSGTYGLAAVLGAIDGVQFGYATVACFVLGWIVSVIAGLYPARVAAQMVPADALRTEI